MNRHSNEDLAGISETTRADYAHRADAFRQGTADHDVSQNVEALLDAIESEPPFRILDLGCGPGRDLRAFLDAGHAPTGLDGTAEFVRMAREATGVTVLQQDFLSLELPRESFDGVFANASLFHVPAQELPRVLRELHDCLVPGGVLFSSNPRGDNSEGWQRSRYGSFHDYDAWSAFTRGAGFEEIRHYYRPPGLPCAQQPWLATLNRKPA